MASSPNDHAIIERFLGLLSEEQRDFFYMLGVRDAILRLAVSPEDRGQRNLEEIQRNLESSQRFLEETKQKLQELNRREKNTKTNNRDSAMAPAKTSHQQSYEIKFGLRHDAGRVIDQMTNEEIVRRITRNKAPFDQVQACRVHATALVLIVSNPEAEAALHGRQHDIGPMLGVPKDDCHLIRQTYQVQIHNFKYRVNGQFSRPKDFILAWNLRNKVNIIDARWTYKKLVLTLDRLGDAQKLVKNGTVWLSGHEASATAFDKRSTPKQCHTCGKPGHLKNQCPEPSKPFCLRCGQQTKEHNAWDGGCKGPECCVNCGRSHPSWSPQCQDAKMRRAREASRFYATKQVHWEKFPAPNSDPTTNTWLKAGQTNSRKRQHADVEEHPTSRAATPAHSDTEMDDYTSESQSQEPSPSCDENCAGESSMHTASSKATSTSSVQPLLKPAQPDITTSFMTSTTSLASVSETASQHPPQATPAEIVSSSTTNSAPPISPEPFTQPTPPKTMADATTPTPTPQRPSQPPAPRIPQPNEFSDTQLGPKPRIIPETPKAPLAPFKLSQSDTAKDIKIKTTRVRRMGGNNVRGPKRERPENLHASFRNFQRQTANSSFD